MAAFGLVVYDDAAAERFSGRGAAQDIAVATHGHHRIAQFELNPAFFAGFERFRAEQAQSGYRLCRAHENLDFCSMLKRLADVFQQTDTRVHTTGGLVLSRLGDDFSAHDLFHSNTGDIDGGA